MKKHKILIMGAAGRDFHNFNVCFRENPEYEVVAFTATQIPNIEGRVYPAVLSGPLYPDGIAIYAESELPRLIKEHQVDQVIFAYSDISHQDLMHKASKVLACGADFRLLSPAHTALPAKIPVVSVCAVRTGVGKSQTTRKVCELIAQAGYSAVVVRHPMPYGDLSKQICQRFASYDDLTAHHCTIEEREEYAPHIERGNTLYAGVDYQVILDKAQQEADILVWDGGNNDFSFYQSDLHIVLVDPLRAGHEISYFPGEANLNMADCVIINKIDSATLEEVAAVKINITKNNPQALIIEAASPFSVENPEMIRDKNVLVIEDGPTLTHGEMKYGAAVLASKNWGAKSIVDPRPYAQGSIKKVYEKYQHLSMVLPAMGYSEEQIRELKETIDATPCDVVVIGTPIDLGKVVQLNKPSVRVKYELEELSKPGLESCLAKVFEKVKNKKV
jgi:predicted GTPase